MFSFCLSLRCPSASGYAFEAARCVMHEQQPTCQSGFFQETSFNDSRVQSTSSSRHAARFLAATSKRCSCARGLTANWRKSVLLSRCAKCAGRIVGRYYVPEMLVRIRIKKIARFFSFTLFYPTVRRCCPCSSHEETFLGSGHVPSTTSTVERPFTVVPAKIARFLVGSGTRRVRVHANTRADCCCLLDRWWPRQ